MTRSNRNVLFWTVGEELGGTKFFFAYKRVYLFARLSIAIYGVHLQPDLAKNRTQKSHI
jgi:hypothetical protein